MCGEPGSPVDEGEGEGEAEVVVAEVGGSERGGTGNGFCSPWLGPSEWKMIGRHFLSS